jgi:hypothetical protein
MRGTAQLARTLDGRMRQRAERPPATDLGTLETGLALRLDHFGALIPPSDYLVEESFTERTRNESGGAGEASFAAHSHVIRVALAVGDRVVCVILDHDSDHPTPIIVGRLA